MQNMLQSYLPLTACGVIFGLGVLSIMYATAFLLVRLGGAPSAIGRYSTIDGLRGYLASFVFLHHSSIWFFYLRTGEWVAPESNVYSQFGSSSVALFFMITGFLFFSKILSGGQWNWRVFYLNRLFRLAPLYLLAILLLFVFVGAITGWELHVSLLKLLGSLFKWLSFTALGKPDINGFVNTWILVAGVMWSLPYEWVFYLLLPLLAFLLRASVPRQMLAISALTVILFFVLGASLTTMLPFISGILAAKLLHQAWLTRFAKSRYGSFLLLVALLIVFTCYSSAYEPVPLALLTIAFILIASGASGFGFLNLPTSRFLGEISYGIYLFHGLALFVTFHYVLGEASAKTFSTCEYWAAITMLAPVLILFCYLTHITLENPGIAYGRKLEERVK